ncbi:hypothetical protein SAMN05443636_2022 [Halobaculum gomorrense]|uniref:Uncharacterized protein n=1 Tax=Halobaculum gomorrense TaxID=43928 RepID=A0A1M5R3L3_9EURY|nr:hypothetical protein SAMN05443636_2022 [Halobaculum gomorrense]
MTLDPSDTAIAVDPTDKDASNAAATDSADELDSANEPDSADELDAVGRRRYACTAGRPSRL